MNRESRIIFGAVRKVLVTSVIFCYGWESVSIDVEAHFGENRGHEMGSAQDKGQGFPAEIRRP